MLPLTLLALTLSSKDLLLVGLFAAACAGGAAFVYRKDDAIEKRRLKAFDVSARYQEEGLEGPAKMLRTYAVGDYDGLAITVAGEFEKMLDPRKVDLEFDRVFKTMLARRMADPVQRAVVAGEVAKLQLMHDPEASAPASKK